MATCTCEKCGASSPTRFFIGYNEDMDMDMEVCGPCSDKFEEGVELYEMHRRGQLAEQQEY